MNQDAIASMGTLSTDILSVVVLLGYAIVASLHDIRYRKIPTWFSVIYAVFAIIGWWQGMLYWSWYGAAMGLLLALVAKIAGGDLKLVIVLGGLSGPLIISIACGSAFIVALTILIADRRRWLPYSWRVALWPMGPFIAGPVCAMVLLTTL